MEVSRSRPRKKIFVEQGVMWTPWTSNVDFYMGSSDRVDGVRKTGNGEYKLIDEANNPWSGASTKGENFSWDLELSEKRWEVKDITSGNDIFVPLYGASKIGQFMAEMNRALNQLEQLSVVLINFLEDKDFERFQTLSLDERSAVNLASDLKLFLESNTRSIRNMEISYGKSLLIRDMFDRIRRFKDLMDKILNSESKHADVIVQLKSQIDLIFIENVPLPPLFNFLKKLGFLSENIGESPLQSTLSCVDHPWFNEISFWDDWTNMITPAEAFSPATDGVIFVHREKGYFHVPLVDLVDWLRFDRISRRAPKFRMIKIPRVA